MSLKNLHPVTLLVYFASVIGFTVASLNPYLLILSFLGAFLGFFIVAKRFDAALYIPLFILIAVMNPIFSHNGQTVLFFLGGQRVTLESVIYGAMAALLVIGVLYWCKLFSLVFETDKLTWAVGRISPKLSVLLTMSIRFIPLIKENARDIYNAQESMGVVQTKGIFAKFKLMAGVFSALISMSIENAIETADTMRAMGYGKGKRTSYTLFRFTAFDAIYVILFAAADIAIFILWKYAEFLYYPYIYVPKFGTGTIILYIIFALFCLFPFINGIKEDLRWRYLISKI